MLRFYDNAASESLACLDVPELSVPAVPLDTTLEEADLTPFLDEILRRLRSLPADMHGEIRRELRAHLESLIAAHEELGLSREDALIAAIGQFGDPSTIARRFRRAYESTLPVATPWAAMRGTLLVFGVGMALYVSLPLLLARGDQFRPINESLLHMLSAVLLWAFPLFAGGWIGRLTPRRAALGVLYGCGALAALAMPLLITHINGSSESMAADSSAYAAVQNLSWCLMGWIPLGCIAAAVTSRVKWSAKLDCGIDALPAFALRGMGFGLLGYLANCAVNYAFSGILLSRGAHTGPSLLSQLAVLLLDGFVIWAAPVWLGVKIGKAWPLLERWTRRQLTYLLAGSLAVHAGSWLVAFALTWTPYQTIGHIVPREALLGPQILTLFMGSLLSVLPVAGIAALVVSNKARGGNPLLNRAGGLIAVVYFVLSALYSWNVGRFVVAHHNPTAPLPWYMNLFSYFFLVAFAVMLWANRRRLPHWKNLLSA